jgi:photosystem II stability/assembly factor-like uncharacterized protein
MEASMRLILVFLLTATTLQGATRIHVQNATRHRTSVWAATFGHGLLRSDDGLTFSPAALPDDVTRVLSIVSSGVSLIAGTEGLGLWRSYDEGRGWKRWDEGLPEFVSVEALLAHPNGAIFAGTTDHGLFVRRARDLRWTRVETFTSTAGVSSLFLHGRTIFAATVGDGLYLSGDTAESWTKANGLLPGETIAALTANGSRVVAVTSEGAIFAADRSGDGKLRFRLLNPAALGGGVYAIAFGARGLYASTSHGIFASTDGGVNWSRLAGADDLPFAGRALWQDEDGRTRLAGRRNPVE